MSKTTFTTIKLGNFINREEGDVVAWKLQQVLKDCYLQPSIGLAPIGGSFDLTLTTTYVFTDDDGKPVADNEKALLAFMLDVMTFELWSALRSARAA